MRRSIVISLVVLALALAFVGGPSLFASPSSSEVAPGEEPSPEIVTPDGSESGFWPYLNARTAHEKRSPINLVVRGRTDEVIARMQAAGEWEETDREHEEADPFTHSIQPGNRTNANATAADDGNASAADASYDPLPTTTPWTRATGATRYAYLDPGPETDAEPYWTTETYQLQDGAYYGQRYHIRLYESPNPDDEWVIMQTHTEHFDWFTLRHRVDGSEAAQSKVEGDFVELPGVDTREDVRRVNLGNGGPSDADGWATFVDLAAAILAPLAVGLAIGGDAVDRAADRVGRHLTEADRRRLAAAYARIEARHLVLAATILAVVLGVRIGGIALERHAGFLSMHGIAAVLYPIVGLGLPVATYLVAGGLERRLDAAVAATGSLAVAIWLDYGLLGIDALPIDVVVQRMLVVVALGLIAGGAARRATRESRLNGMVLVGAAAWALVLLGTLFGYL